MTEYASPAAISDVSAPSRSACFTCEFINTVQREPKSQGFGAVQASLPNDSAVWFNVWAKFCMNEPHPDEHASLISTF